MPLSPYRHHPIGILTVRKEKVQIFKMVLVLKLELPLYPYRHHPGDCGISIVHEEKVQIYCIFMNCYFLAGTASVPLPAPSRRLWNFNSACSRGFRRNKRSSHLRYKKNTPSKFFYSPSMWKVSRVHRNF